MRLHTCKTTTTIETRLHEEAAHYHRKDLHTRLDSYDFKQSYRRLLQGEPSVELKWDGQPFALPMKRSMLGLYMLELRLDRDSYRFVIDSGAQISAIRPELAQKHHAKPLTGSVSIGSIGGREKQMHGYLVNELRLGNLTIARLPMVSLETAGLHARFGSMDLSLFDGILGWDILAQLDFELDDVAHEFKVLRNCYHFAHPNMVKTVFPVFLVRDKQERLLTMGFDSGARESWMSAKRMRALGYELGKERLALGFGVHGLEEIKVNSISEMDLYLYKAHIHLRHVRTGRTNVFPKDSLDGILGNEIYKNRRIRIINSMEMVLLA